MLRSCLLSSRLAGQVSSGKVLEVIWFVGKPKESMKNHSCCSHFKQTGSVSSNQNQPGTINLLLRTQNSEPKGLRHWWSPQATPEYLLFFWITESCFHCTAAFPNTSGSQFTWLNFACECDLKEMAEFKQQHSDSANSFSPTFPFLFVISARSHGLETKQCICLLRFRQWKQQRLPGERASVALSHVKQATRPPTFPVTWITPNLF